MLDLYLAILIALLMIFAHWQVFRHWLPRPVARIGFLIYTVNLALLILYILSSDLKIIPYALIWNLNLEDNIPTIYSSVQFSSVALVAISVVFFAKRLTLLQRSYWLAISLTYFALSADELTTNIHEYRIAVSNFYLLLGAGLVIGTVSMLVTESKPGKRCLFMVLLGLAASALGGLILDRGAFCFLQLESPPCAYFSYLEETLELVGNGLILVAVLGYASHSISLHPSRVLLGFALAVSFIWPGLPVAGMLVQVIIPLVDLQTRAQKISVELSEAPVQVLGFWQGIGEFTTEREITLHLYLRTEPVHYDDFGFSYTLLDQNTQEVVAKADHWGDRKIALNTVQGIHRQSESFTIPATAPRNRALWLTLSFWYQDEDGAYHDYTISASDRRLLSERQVILTEFVLPTEVDPSSGSSIATFDNGFELRQVELPAEAYAGEPINAIFTWFTANDATEDWSQFLHFVHEESSTFWNHDQPPLGTRLPNRLWYAGLTDHETWQFTLSADLPPGRYQLYTGLYRLSDMTRMTGYDEVGVLLPVGRLPLGYIQIVPISEGNDG